MVRLETPEPYTRRNSLRLTGFDYAAKRYYFVTLVTLDRRKLFCEPALAKATLECLSELRTRMGFKVYSYCLMPDHFHGLFGLADSGKTLGEICGGCVKLQRGRKIDAGTKSNAGRDKPMPLQTYTTNLKARGITRNSTGVTPRTFPSASIGIASSGEKVSMLTPTP